MKHEKAYLEALTVSEARNIKKGLLSLKEGFDKNDALFKRINRLACRDIIYLEDDKTVYSRKMP